jgi:parallel beta helix pectate lyase-like protein
MLVSKSILRTSSVLLLCLTAACGSDGSGGSGGGGGGGDIDPEFVPDLGRSEFRVTPAFGTPADGLTEVAIELSLRNHRGLPIVGAVVTLEVTGCGNAWQTPSPTGADGRTSTGLTSLAGERKSITARTQSGGKETVLGTRQSEFLLVAEHTYFVRRSGSDARSGRSPREAWQTLDHALASAEPGATIHVGAGEYPGPLTLSVDSSAESPFVISGDRDGAMTGDAGAVVIAGGGAAHALRLLGAKNVVLQGLTLSGAETGLRLEGCTDVRVFACWMQESDVGLEVAEAERLVVQDCRVSANRMDGLRLAGTRDTRIENNLVYANLGDGLELLAPAQTTVVRFNTFFHNSGSHLREEFSGGTGAVQENILAESGESALDLADSSGYQTSTNLVWGSSGLGTSRNTPDGVVEADPLFVDPWGLDLILGGIGADDDDFRLLPESIAIDLGSQLARDVVLGSHESLATRTTREDGVREASGDDLPLTNLGFHLAEGSLPFTSLSKGGGRVLHAIPGEVRPELRAWERAEPGLAPSTTGPVLDGEIVHLEQRLSPIESREELLAAQIDTGTRGRIVVRHWDGRRWSDPAHSPFVDDIPLAELVDKRFDLEYEARSGRAMIVLADDDGIPSYQTLERGRWSPLHQAFASAPGAGRVRLVELVPHPGTDELALVTLDDQRDLSVSLWDGAAWSTPRMLETNTIFAPSWRPFDAAFESRSGDLVVTWGFSTFAEETRWATLDRASGLWRTGQHPSTDAIGAHIVLAADPASDRIAAVMGEGSFDNDVICSMWDGTDWVHTAELTLLGPIANRMLDVAWFGETGVACVVFRRLGHSGSFNAAFFLPTGWRVQPDVVLPGVGRAVKLRLVGNPLHPHLLGLVLDQNGKLFGLHHDGTGFGLLNGGEAMAEGFDPARPGRPFDAALLR